MSRRSVENGNKIRVDIKIHALLSRSSTDIYAGIYTVNRYGSNSMSCSTVCRLVRNSVQTWGLL